ncbi:MAG TPA: hypothetical protein VK178_12570 [Opitutaceae bacterium]|nr:hypothetical protein [Opitutaceae bacterium]
MSVRYEMPSSDYEERRKQEAAQDERWKTLAEEATRNDPVFQRWKRRHWIFTGAVASLVFASASAITAIMHNPKRYVFGEFRAPFVLGGAVLAWGGWIYTQKIRSIGVRAWAAKRSEEVAKTRALNKPLDAKSPTAPTSSPRPEGLPLT